MTEFTPHITQTVTGDRNIFSATGDVFVINNPPPLPPGEALTRSNLRLLLQKVKAFWIDGVLEKSIHREVLLDLGKQLQPTAIEHPWDLALELPDRTPQSLPSGTMVIDVFDKTNRALLILGEPGSGKTISLLELCRDLIIRVEEDESFNQPLPIVLNLSTWTDKWKTLLDWMIHEISSKYQVPRRVSRVWLRENRLLPLLDGLDEVLAKDRAACVKAINRFGETYGLAGIAVCSRLQEYSELPERLRLQGALLLRPITPEQADDYLNAVGPELDGLRTAIRTNSSLQTLARTPLMLSIMSLAYREVPSDALVDLKLATVEDHRRHIFKAYENHMLERRSRTDQRYEPGQFRSWLCWLAQGMSKHNQTVFLIEQLQPSWLPSRLHRLFYVFFSRLVVGLGLGLFFLLSGELITWMIGESSQLNLDGIIPRFLAELTRHGLIIGLLGGLIVGFMDTLRFAVGSFMQEKIGFPSPGLEKIVTKIISLLGFLGVWSFVGVIVALYVGRIIRLSEGPFQELLGAEMFGNLAGSLVGVLSGLVFGLLFGIRITRTRVNQDVQAVEGLSVSLRGAFIGGCLGLIIGPIAGLVIGIVISRISVGITNQLLRDLPDSTFFSLLGEEANFALRALLMAGEISNGEITEVREQMYNRISEQIGLFASILGPILGGCYGLIGAPIGAMLGGLRRRKVAVKARPNQGTRLSARNAVLVGLPMGLAVGLVSILIVGVLDRPDLGLNGELFGDTFNLVGRKELGLIVGLWFGFVSALMYGGIDVVQHYSLRLILHMRKLAPWNYAKFLDYATERVFLQKVGGGYTFIHRYLRDYFAELYH